MPAEMLALKTQNESQKILRSGEKFMKKQWALCGIVAGLLTMAGCGNSGTATNPGTDTSTTAGGGPAGSPTSAPSSRKSEAQAPRPIVVPAGTTIPVILTSSLSSRTSSPGDEFEGSTAEPVSVGGEVAIPKGSSARGTVLNAKKQGAFAGQAVLSIKLTRITVRGKGYALETSAFNETEKGKGKRTAVVTGGGAAVGALIGGLAGGGKGAAIGAGVGGGGGLAASGATGGKNVTLPAETRVNFKLAEDLTIEP